MFDLDERCINLVQKLLHRDEYLRIQDIANENNISKRSVYYDLCKINDFLESENIDNISVERNKGILLNSKQRNELKKIIDVLPNNTNHVFSPMERVSIIICTIINRDTELFIEDFMQLTQVSRNTTINDIKATASKLNEYNLKLVYENGEGYIIKGDIIRKRAMFFLFFNDISEYYQNGTLPIVGAGALRNNLIKLSKIEESLDTKYVEGTLFKLAFFIPKLVNTCDHNLNFDDVDQEMLMGRKEYLCVAEQFPELDNNEKIYLTLHLLGSRLQTMPMNDVIVEEDKEAYDLAKALVSEFARIACIEFENKEDIERNLFGHIKTSLYRYRYGIQLGNPLLDDIKVQYADLFEITKNAVEYLNQQIGVPINDSEIAYLTLHFGGAVQRGTVKKHSMRILIVCPNGISTGNMLKGEVLALVPHADVIDVKSLDNVDNLVDNYDVFISTIPLNINKSCVLVHPILTDADRLLIMKKCIVRDLHASLKTDALVALLKPYLKDGCVDEVKKVIDDFIDTKESMTYTRLKTNHKGLMDYLDINHVRFVNRDVDWQESIKLSGEILVEEGYVDKGYIDAIVDQNEKFGPYMFINKNIVLAHAKIEDGVNRIGLSVGIFNNGVKFDKDKTAKLIFVLAAEDQVKHLSILKDLMKVCHQENAVSKLLQCIDEETFMENLGKLIETN